MTESIRLTQTVQKGGCAAKIPALELRKILGLVNFKNSDPNVLVDGGLFDDAGVYRINDEISLVQTLDFFTPILDTPFLFGRVAAANALSDVYAMGGEPRTAMGILAFPHSQFSHELVAEIMQGACSALDEAKCSMVGGHSIDDDTLKYGLSVTGVVATKNIWSNSKARVGDHLILTKALGTGAITAALKRSEVSEEQIKEATDSMCLINRTQDLLNSTEWSAIHSATDITGFGLAGHSYQMALASKVAMHINYENLPILSQAMDFIAKGFLTKAHRTNREYVELAAKTDSLNDLQIKLLCDPQTSGGLLLSVDPSLSAKIVDKLQVRFPRTRVIGEVLSFSDSRLVIE